MAQIYTGNNSCTERDVVVFGPLRLWAERGLLHLEDERDNSYVVVSVHEALRRMNAISEMLANGKRQANTENQFDACNRLRHQNMLDAVLALCEKAKIQGMPTDASARRDLVRRRPKTFVVPAPGGGF